LAKRPITSANAFRPPAHVLVEIGNAAGDRRMMHQHDGRRALRGRERRREPGQARLVDLAVMVAGTVVSRATMRTAWRSMT